MKVVILNTDQIKMFPIIGIMERIEPIKDINGNLCLSVEQFEYICYNKKLIDYFTKEELLTMQVVEFEPPQDELYSNYEDQKSWFSKVIQKVVDYFKS